MVGHLGWADLSNFQPVHVVAFVTRLLIQVSVNTALRNYGVISGLCRLLLIMLSVRAPYCLGFSLRFESLRVWFVHHLCHSY